MVDIFIMSLVILSPLLNKKYKTILSNLIRLMFELNQRRCLSNSHINLLFVHLFSVDQFTDFVRTM